MSYAPWDLLQLDLQLDVVLYHLYQLSIAFGLSLPIAYNRESRSQGAGLRTFPLVALAACAYTLLARNVYVDEEAAARVVYGIITGIGFIGGGAIIKHGSRVGGTATAAGIWNTGSIGVTVAYSRYEIALLLSLLNFLIFQFAGRFKAQKSLEEKSLQDDQEPAQVSR